MPAHLKPMTQTEFESYQEILVKDYAQENVEAGYWDESDAIERSRKSVSDLLPQGVATPNHHIFTVCEGEQRVGIVWMRATLDAPIKSGFIFDIAIEEDQRSKGFGKQTMQLVEDQAREMGLTQMGLHVFAKNKVARNLYEGLGYEVKSLNMTKLLANK